jgi:hypothetical protein
MLKKSLLAVSIMTGLLGSTSVMAQNVTLVRANSVEVKIVGGTEATPHALPYQVSLQGLDGSHFCGGSIIGEDMILTAAHCVEGMAKDPSLQVHVGAHNVKLNVGERIRVTEVYSHKEYPGLSKDVAVLKLSKKISDKNAKAVKLADQAFFDANLKPGVKMTVSGWGTLTSGGNLPDKLMHVEVPYVTNATCNGGEAYNGQVQDTEMCGGYKAGGKDSCQGDSGGPLVIKQNGEFVQVGVVSWGEGCAAANKYGVYANVAALNPWITNAAGGSEAPGGGSGGDNGGGDGGDNGDDGGELPPSQGDTSYFALQVSQSWSAGDEQLELVFDVPEGVNMFYVATRGDNGELDLEVSKVEADDSTGTGDDSSNDSGNDSSNDSGGEENPDDWSDDWSEEWPGDWDWNAFENNSYYSDNDGSNESVVIEFPAAGQYTIKVNGYEDYKDVEFTVIAH